MNYKLDVAIAHKAILGEGPVWDEKKNVLFWIDSLGNQVLVFDPRTDQNRAYDVGQSVGTVVLTDNENEVLVGLADGIYTLDLDSGKLSFRINPEEGIKGNRLNDGKADAYGRLWIGSMSIADNGVEGYDTLNRCNLHCVETNFQSRIVDPDVRLANGMAWTQDNKSFYFVDSPTRTVYRYDFDLEKGKLSNRTVCIQIPEDFGVCDGMDIDEDGNLWIAHWTGWCVGKWDPRTGELLGKIDVPVSRVASCAFGGRNYDELYIVTASVNADMDEKIQPQAGYVFVASDLGTKGITFNRFQGQMNENEH